MPFCHTDAGLHLSEEVLAQNHALWFSPAGNSLAFIRFNDSMGR